ncbi:MAG TPA: hypothetical protein PK156_00345, partial [Polyangium sp.]|nr:hypothetical protein [Polyangium sp.]
WIFSFIMAFIWRRIHQADRTAPGGDGFFRATLQTIRGRRSFIGLSDWNEEIPFDVPAGLILKSMMAPTGLFSIDNGLVPENADSGTRLRSRIYYMYEKNTFLDLVLVGRCIQGAFIRWARKALAILPRETAPTMRARS